MKRILKGLAAVIGLVAIAVVLFIYAPGSKSRLEGVFAVPAFEPVVFDTLRKTPNPNQYLVCPPAACLDTPDMVSPTFAVTIDQLQAATQAALMKQPDVTLRNSDIGARQFDYVQRTPRMRYPDLITIRFMEASDSGATFAIYSRSVYGRSDLGVNKARVDQLISDVKAALGA